MYVIQAESRVGAYIMTIAKRRIATIFLALGTSACAFGPQLQRVAVNHNQLVANSNNELVLVNILRARDREPLHFTSVSKLSGDAQLQGTASTNVAIKGPTSTVKTDALGRLVDTATLAGTEVTTPSLQLNINSKTSMDVAVWDTQEFYQGITGSVPSSTVAHYLHQGWPSDLLTYALISSVDLVAKQDGGGWNKGQVVRSYVNDPDDSDAKLIFERFANCHRLEVVQKSGTLTQIVPLASVKDLKLADLALLDGDKFEIDEKEDAERNRWIRRKGKGGDTLAVRRLGNATDCELENTTSVAFFTSEGASEMGSQEGHNFVGAGTYGNVPVDVQLVLRSVDGLIYFLGEYIRAQQAPYRLAIDGRTVPLLTVTKQRPARVFVSTEYKGQRYYVPASDEGQLDEASGRSAQVFALVEQLLNLHKNAKDRPTTQTVRVQ